MTILKDCLNQLARSGLKTRVKIRRNDVPNDTYHWFEDLLEKREINVNDFRVIAVSQSDIDLVYYLQVEKLKQKETKVDGNK